MFYYNLETYFQGLVRETNLAQMAGADMRNKEESEVPNGSSTSEGVGRVGNSVCSFGRGEAGALEGLMRKL